MSKSRQRKHDLNRTRRVNREVDIGLTRWSVKERTAHGLEPLEIVDAKTNRDAAEHVARRPGDSLTVTTRDGWLTKNNRRIVVNPIRLEVGQALLMAHRAQMHLGIPDIRQKLGTLTDHELEKCWKAISKYKRALGWEKKRRFGDGGRSGGAVRKGGGGEGARVGAGGDLWSAIRM